MKGYKVTVTASPTLLVLPDDKNRRIYVSIISNETVAFGASDVAFAEGLHVVKHSAVQQFDVPLGEAIYAIADAGKTCDVRVLMPDGD